MTIPKITHQIWMQGWENLPEKFQENVAGLHETNPGYSHMKWDDQSLKEQCAKFSKECAEKYDSFEHLHSKVDFGRYVVLYNYGGISIDTDMVALSPIDNTPDLDDGDFFISEITYPGNLIGLKNNAVIICKPQNSVLKDGITRIIEDKRASKDFKMKEEYINETTGPGFMSKLVSEHKDKVKVLSYKYYEPCSPKDPYCEIPETAIMDHQHELSWTSSVYQFFIWLMYFILHYFWVFVLIIVLVVVYRNFGKNIRSLLIKR